MKQSAVSNDSINVLKYVKESVARGEIEPIDAILSIVKLFSKSERNIKK